MIHFKHSIPLSILLLSAPGYAIAQQPAPEAPAPAAAAEEPRPLGPAEEAVLESNPQSPAELTGAVLTLIGLDRSDLAAPLLKKVVESKPAGDVLADIGRRFGTAAMMRLSRERALAPEASDFAQAVIAAYAQSVREPARLRRLIEQLDDPSPAKRRAALVDLAQAQRDAVVALISALGEAEMENKHAAIRGALVELGPLAIDPLLAALETPEPGQKAQIIQALAEIDPGRAAVYIVGPAVSANSDEVRTAARSALRKVTSADPTADAAALALFRQIERYLNGTFPQAPDHEGLVQSWHFDPPQKSVVLTESTADDARIFAAARLARDLGNIDPENPRYRRLSLAMTLEAAKRRSGYGRPLAEADPALASAVEAAGPDVIEDVLDFAIEEPLHGAAIAAAETLGKIGGLEAVFGLGRTPTPLVRALGHDDPRVRFAAVESVMQIAPRRPFAGSSSLPDSLAYFISTIGAGKAIIAGHHVEKAQTLGALLGQLGYEIELASHGRRLFELATHSADVAVIFVDQAIDDPPLRELLYALRRDARTAEVPIAVLATQGRLDEAKRIAADHPLIEAYPRPQDVAAVQFQVERLAERLGRRAVPVEERLLHASRALDHVRELAAASPPLFDMRQLVPVVESALYVPGLSESAAAVLGQLGTAGGHRALVDMASLPTLPIAARRAAADAFHDSVRRFGVLLTSDEILLQYDRYNASEQADQQTQEVLGLLLDTIETPSKVQAR